MSTAASVATIIPFTVPCPKQTIRHRVRGAYLKAEQLKAFLQAARERGPREHAAFLFAAVHGARVQEICNLKLTDLNMTQKTVHIARLKGSLTSVQSLYRPSKGDPLFDEEAAFAAWLAVRKVDKADSDYVFNSHRTMSGRMSKVQLFRLFQAICEQAGIPASHQHPHVLKHTCARLMFAANVNAFTIKTHLGHASFNSTLEYTKPTSLEASEAFAAALDGVL